MDARIGELSSGKFYAYLNGYNAEPFVGSLVEVEVAMDLRAEEELAQVVAAAPVKTYTVRLSFQYPAWDEVDGIEYRDIQADSKSEANAWARRMAEQDGHLCGGKGRATFTATED